MTDNLSDIHSYQYGTYLPISEKLNSENVRKCVQISFGLSPLIHASLFQGRVSDILVFFTRERATYGVLDTYYMITMIAMNVKKSTKIMVRDSE